MTWFFVTQNKYTPLLGIAVIEGSSQCNYSFVVIHIILLSSTPIIIMVKFYHNNNIMFQLWSFCRWFLQVGTLKIFEEVGSFLNGGAKGHSFLTVESFVLIGPL